MAGMAGNAGKWFEIDVVGEKGWHWLERVVDDGKYM